MLPARQHRAAWIRLGCGGDLRGLRTDMSIVLLARDLGLSISTVSRALNGYHDVAPATKQRVLKRAREIGYRPNPGARRLKSSRSSLVGVILPAASDGVRFVDSVASSLLGGVEVELENGGYGLIATMQTRNDLEREAALYENFIKGGWVDALLLVRTRVTDARVELVRKAHIPFVTYERTETAEPYAWVDTDNEKAFYLATLRQIEFGHERRASRQTSITWSLSYWCRASPIARVSDAALRRTAASVDKNVFGALVFQRGGAPTPRQSWRRILGSRRRCAVVALGKKDF